MDNKLVLCCVCVVLCLGIIYFGVRKIMRYYNAKEICTLKISDTNVKFDIFNRGAYSISIVGGGAIKYFSPIISTDSNLAVEVNEIFFKHKFYKNGKLGVTQYYFMAENSGSYNFKVNNIDNIAVKPSMLKSLSYFEKNVDSKNLYIVIREYVSPVTYIVGLLFSFIGTFTFFLVITYLLYLQGVIPSH